ncbi:hypothetical protein A1OO_19370 [Enterovibrio norvegicus FF-33]|uniref:Toxin co-regulated pilus biosynthesis protein Q C-terminal domain-containing protein n=1 Tax=Enterovibrio norvegicus FF-454 TaxID=1185651 RepID=A0A1E5C095_9GAMM|nr:hypothetical protein A1OK_02770 [Enterovibrio norvegicus FF-454]OEE67899.1 hypothetical protein A1OO_19370 [Enterovibrio norvegicus FF-33]OEE73976.1 hypothetical protein A1OQ_10190 [Enterovibrio norvegicus FF-162]
MRKKLIIKLTLVGLSLVMSHPVMALRNNTYSTIIQMNSWATENDIYLSEDHLCTGSEKSLYKLSKIDNQQFSLLLAAFSSGFKVRLNYDCASNDYPIITAIRVQK